MHIREAIRPAAAPLARAIVVDDHPIVVDAVITAISGLRLFVRAEAAHSLDQARTLLEANGECALAILDLHLGDIEARDTLLGFRERFPQVPVIVFTGDESLESITMAFECGARGYVTKNSPMHVLASAIRIVTSGGSYVPPEAMQILGFGPASLQWESPRGDCAASLRLSGRQTQVFGLLLQGMPNKVIGSRLDMAEGTVKAHLNAIFRALGVRTRVEAILRARQLGLI